MRFDTLEGQNAEAASHLSGAGCTMSEGVREEVHKRADAVPDQYGTTQLPKTSANNQ